LTSFLRAKLQAGAALHDAAVTGGEERFVTLSFWSNDRNQRFPAAKQMGVLAKIAAASVIVRRRIQYVEPFLQGVRKSATQELVVNERLDE
jgi:hypothetical protein